MTGRVRGVGLGPPAPWEPENAPRPRCRWRGRSAAALGLPARQRAAIVFRYYEDLSETQIGRARGCAPATVRSLVSRRLRTLRQNPRVIG